MVYVLGISGASGSGKTTLGRELQKRLGFDRCKMVYQDSYYLDQSEDFDEDGGAINFDHPKSLDFERMAADIAKLKSGQSVEVPIYDFATHKRETRTRLVPAAEIVILDGILIFTQPQILKLLDHKIFVDTPQEVCFERRLQRDVEERGRTAEGVRLQYEKHVRPMFEEFVAPSSAYADQTVVGVGDYKPVALDLANHILSELRVNLS